MDQDGQIEKTVEVLLAGTGIELVGVEIVGSRGNPTVRVFVDKPEGISVEDCARVSRALQDQFDAAGLLPGRYVLEVSSPGIDRLLRRPKDFERFSGESAQVQTYEKIGGRHRHTGLLDGYDREKQTVVLTDDSGTRVEIPLGAIKKANLKRDPWARARKK